MQENISLLAIVYETQNKNIISTKNCNNLKFSDMHEYFR